MAYHRKLIQTVLFFSLLILCVQAFCQPPTPAPDINGDGVVDHEDLLMIQNYWQTGEKYTPSPTPTITETPTITPTPTITETPTATPTLETYTLQLPNEATMDFCEIPAGSFLMGLPGTGSRWNFCFEMGIDADCAAPVHAVTFEHSFYMGKTEVTRAQWFAVMGSLPDEIADEEPDTRPINYVSWNDTQDFVSLLNNLGQGAFRLPSEAEWEYACRAGSTTRFYFGDSDCDPDYVDDPCSCELDRYAWWGCNVKMRGHPIGQKLPNAWNLYDMHGNVWERCQDDWHIGFDGAPTDGSAWVDGHGSTVGRGGGFLSDPIECQSASRASRTRTGNGEITGFRVVREKN